MIEYPNVIKSSIDADPINFSAEIKEIIPYNVTFQELENVNLTEINLEKLDDFVLFDVNITIKILIAIISYLLLFNVMSICMPYIKSKMQISERQHAEAIQLRHLVPPSAPVLDIKWAPSPS